MKITLHILTLLNLAIIVDQALAQQVDGDGSDGDDDDGDDDSGGGGRGGGGRRNRNGNGDDDEDGEGGRSGLNRRMKMAIYFHILAFIVGISIGLAIYHFLCAKKCMKNR